MDPSLVTPIASAAGGLCCCLFWVVAIIALILFLRRRKGGQEEGVATASIDEKPAANMASENKGAEAKAEAKAAAEDEDPESIATVVAANPTRPDSKEPPKAAPPKPRTSGATIIAFDDDLADDE